MESSHRGGCACGAVRYEAEGDPRWCAGCCCRDCATATGTPCVVWVGFSPGQVAVTGETFAQYESSQGVLRGYCRACGTSVSYGRHPDFDSDDPLFYVSAVTLDAPETFEPSEVLWYSQRPPWFELSGDIPLQPGPSELHADRAMNNVLAKKGE